MEGLSFPATSSIQLPPLAAFPGGCASLLPHSPRPEFIDVRDVHAYTFPLELFKTLRLLDAVQTQNLSRQVLLIRKERGYRPRNFRL